MSTLPASLLPGSRRIGALPWLIAASCFLVVLAAGAALALGRASQAIDAAVGGQVTVQLLDADPARRDSSAADAVTLLRRLPAVRAVRPVANAEIERLLRPTLGGAPLDDLPLPALIDVTLARGGTADALRAPLSRIPGAEVQPEGAALQPLAALVRTLGRLALAIALVAAATGALVTALVARAALAAHGATIDTLHALGATDGQLVRLLQRRIARDALLGGGVGFVGGALAIRLIGARLAALDAGIGGRAGIAWGGWLALAALPLLLTGLAVLAMRIAARSGLARAA